MGFKDAVTAPPCQVCGHAFPEPDEVVSEADAAKAILDLLDSRGWRLYQRILKAEASNALRALVGENDPAEFPVRQAAARAIFRRLGFEEQYRSACERVIEEAMKDAPNRRGNLTTLGEKLHAEG